MRKGLPFVSSLCCVPALGFRFGGNTHQNQHAAKTARKFLVSSCSSQSRRDAHQARSTMDTRTVVSIVPAVMQAAQLRGAAVLDAAAFGARVLRSGVGRVSTVPLESGPAAVLLGVCVCIVAPLMLAVFHLALARSAWAELPWSRRVFVASCTKDLLNAVTATPCALAALFGLLLGRPDASLSCTTVAAGAAGAAGAAAESSLLAQKLPALGLVACGITCGFFAADCVVLWRHGDELSAEMGRTNTRLMWPHHLLSLVVWPYCAVYGRGGVFVLCMSHTARTPD